MAVGEASIEVVGSVAAGPPAALWPQRVSPPGPAWLARLRRFGQHFGLTLAVLGLLMLCFVAAISGMASWYGDPDYAAYVSPEYYDPYYYSIPWYWPLIGIMLSLIFLLNHALASGMLIVLGTAMIIFGLRRAWTASAAPPATVAGRPMAPTALPWPVVSYMLVLFLGMLLTLMAYWPVLLAFTRNLF